MRKLSVLVQWAAVTGCLLLGLAGGAVLADGDETLGPPLDFNVASGTGISGGGIGLADDASGTILVDLPDGATIQQVILYWSGEAQPLGNLGDDMITVNGASVEGVEIGTTSLTSDQATTWRQDVTGLETIAPGNVVTLLIEDMDFNEVNYGAGALVIYDDGSDPSDIDIRDGHDHAFIDNPLPDRDVTVRQDYNFGPSDADREGTLVLLFGDAVPDRSEEIEIWVGNDLILLQNELNSDDGAEFDTLVLPLTVPAGVDVVTVQAFSRGPGLPDSLAWMLSTLQLPRSFGIDIRKEAEGPDTRTFPTGSDVPFQIVVTNTGDEPLVDVAVTDEQVPGCAQFIGDLDVDEEFPYECTSPAVDGSFTNVACVEGATKDGEPVADCDPSTVEIIDIDIRKQAEGEDSRTFPPGSDVEFLIVVTNTGDETLFDVVVVDPMVPTCINEFSVLEPGQSVPYDCTALNVTKSFTNVACVTGQRNGVEVGDCDPSTVEIEGTPPLGALGDRVWWDMDQDGEQDPDEPGIDGVVVNLFDCEGNLLGTDVTDENGIYGFDELPLGCYTVEVDPDSLPYCCLCDDDEQPDDEQPDDEQPDDEQPDDEQPDDETCDADAYLDTEIAGSGLNTPTALNAMQSGSYTDSYTWPDDEGTDDEVPDDEGPDDEGPDDRELELCREFDEGPDDEGPDDEGTDDGCTDGYATSDLGTCDDDDDSSDDEGDDGNGGEGSSCSLAEGLSLIPTYDLDGIDTPDVASVELVVGAEVRLDVDFGYDCDEVTYDGCAADFWRTQANFDEWIQYDTSDRFEEVFGVEAPVNDRLLWTMWRRGTGFVQLNREAVTALLNSGHQEIGFRYTEAEVLEMVRAAYETGDLDRTMQSLRAENVKTCPLLVGIESERGGEAGAANKQEIREKQRRKGVDSPASGAETPTRLGARRR